MAATSRFDKSFVETLVKEPVDSFAVGVGSKKGDNVAGDIYSIKIQTKSGRTENVVVKVLPDKNPLLASVVKENRIFSLEISIYTTLANQIKSMGEKFGLTTNEATLPLPKYFHGICDGENDFLALEDERPAGFKMADKYVGLNFDEVTVILKELARFHALTYFLIKYEGERVFEDIKLEIGLHKDSPEAKMMVQALFGTSFNIAMGKVAEIKSLGPDVVEKVKAVIDGNNIRPNFLKTGKLTDRKAFPVILHGDCWTNNILLKYDDNGKPVAVKFVDFQQTRRGNIYEDLTYFLFASTTPAFRKDYLIQVLSTYYDTFVAFLAKLNNCPAPLGFTKGSFLDTFSDCYLPIYIYMLYAIPCQLGTHSDKDSSSSEGPVDKEKAFGEWLQEIGRMYSDPAVMERLEQVTQECVDLNVF